MDTFIIILIIAIGVINALARAFKDKKRKQAGESGKAPREEAGPLEQFLKRFHDEQFERAPFVTEEEVVYEEPEPPKKPPVPPKRIEIEPARQEVRARVSKDFAEPLLHEPEERLKGLVRKPFVSLAGPALTTALEETTGERPFEIDAESAGTGIVMAEILGPPVAKRRGGMRARRLF